MPVYIRQKSYLSRRFFLFFPQAQNTSLLQGAQRLHHKSLVKTGQSYSSAFVWLLSNLLTYRIEWETLFPEKRRELKGREHSGDSVSHLGWGGIFQVLLAQERCHRWAVQGQCGPDSRNHYPMQFKGGKQEKGENKWISGRKK